MNEPAIILLSLGSATVIFLPLVLVLTLVYECGFMGILVATVVTMVLRFIFAILFVSCKQGFEEANAARLFSRETFENLGYQARLGLAALLFNVPSWWVTDLLLLLCTFIGEDAVGAQTIMRGLCTIIAVIPFSFSCASGFYIGKAIGAEDKAKIKFYFKASVYFSFLLGGGFALLLLSCRKVMIAFYTDQEDTVE